MSGRRNLSLDSFEKELHELFSSFVSRIKAFALDLNVKTSLSGVLSFEKARLNVAAKEIISAYEEIFLKYGEAYSSLLLSSSRIDDATRAERVLGAKQKFSAQLVKPVLIISTRAQIYLEDIAAFELSGADQILVRKMEDLQKLTPEILLTRWTEQTGPWGLPR